MTEDLYKALHVADVDQAEFECVLSNHFKTATEVNVGSIVYPGEEKNFAVRIDYDGDLIKMVSGGSALTDEDIQTLIRNIESELMTPRGRRVASRVLFANVPVDAAFRCKDLFQIRPVPADAPRLQFQFGEHPFIIEFTYEVSSNALICNLRRDHIARQLELTLAALLRSDIKSIGRNIKHYWVLKPEQVGTSVELTSEYLQEGYSFKGMNAEAENFLNIGDLSRITIVDPVEYYSRLGISTGQTLDLPSNFEEMLNCFFALSHTDRECFLRAAFWLQHAHSIYRQSRSASFTALVSAIEAIMPGKAGGGAVCPTCNREQTGPTKHFVDFIEDLAPTVPTKERKKFYRIRSKLSHGGNLLHSDQLQLRWGLTPAKTEEWMDLDSMWSLARVVLINWLLKRDNVYEVFAVEPKRVIGK